MTTASYNFLLYYIVFLLFIILSNQIYDECQPLPGSLIPTSSSEIFNKYQTSYSANFQSIDANKQTGKTDFLHRNLGPYLFPLFSFVMIRDVT